jgi:hypothetical protein
VSEGFAVFLKVITREQISHFCDMAVSCYKMLSTIENRENIPTSQSFSGMLRSGFNVILTSLSGEFFRSMKTLLLSFASLSLFGDTYNKIVSKVVGSPRSLSVQDFLINVVDSLIHMIAAIERYFHTGVFRDIFLCEDPALQALTQAKELLMYSDFLYTGVPVPGKKCIREYCSELKNSIGDLENAIKLLKPTHSMVAQIKDTLINLKKEKLEKEGKLGAMNRPEPIAFVVYSHGGVGKGKIMTLIYETHSYCKGRNFHPTHVYNRIVDSEYNEGYEVGSTPYWHLSDVGSETKMIAQNKGSRAIEELTSLISTEPYPVNMAHLDVKGNVYACPELVMVDTNNKFLNIQHMKTNRQAYERRFHYVEVSVLDEYKQGADFPALDVTKSLEVGGNLLDRWSFTMYTVPIGYKNNVEISFEQRKKFLCRNVRVEEFVETLKEVCNNWIVKTSNTTDDAKFSAKVNMPHLFPEVGKCEEGTEELDAESFVFKKFKDPLKNMRQKIDNKRKCMQHHIRKYYEKVRSHPKVQAGSIRGRFKDEYSPDDSGLSVSFELSDDASEEDIDEVKRQADLIEQEKLPLYMYMQAYCHYYYYTAKENWEDFMRSRYIFMLLTYCTGFACFGRALLYKFTHYLLRRADVKKQTMFRQDWMAFSFVTFYFSLFLGNILSFGTFSLLSVIFSFNPLSMADHASGVAVSFGAVAAKRKYKQWMRRAYDYFGWDYDPNSDSAKYLEMVGYGAGIYITYRAVRPIISFIVDKVTSNRNTVSKVEDISESSFHVDSCYNPILMEKEKSYQCGGSRVRVKNVLLPEHWNVKEEYLVEMPKFTSTSNGLKEVCKRNVSKFFIYAILDDGKEVFISSTHAFGVKSEYVVTTFHSFYTDKYNKWKLRENHLGVNQDVLIGSNEFIITKDDIVQVDVDICVVHISGKLYKNVLKHFGNDLPGSIYTGCTLQGKCSFELHKMNRPVRVGDSGKLIVYKEFLKYTEPHFNGKCGLPLFADVKSGSVIVGIHSAGRPHTNDSFGLRVYKSLIEKAILNMKDKSVYVPCADEPVLAQNYSNPPPKSLVNYEVLHGMVYKGFDGSKVLVNNSSKLVSQSVNKELVSILELEGICSVDHRREFGKPLMKPKTIEGNYVSPYNIAMKNLSRYRPALDPVITNRIIDEVLGRIKELEVVDVSPYDIETSINGCINDGYFRRINTSTGAGYGFPGKKTAYLELVVDDPGKVVREPVESLKHRICEILESYERNERVHFVYKGQLKDEPRDLAKCKSGKTRVFYMTALDALIINRMFLGPFYSLMSQFRTQFCVACGVDMMSQDVDEIVTRLTKFSEVLFEGDYSKFDQSHLRDVAHTTNTIIYKFLSERGYNDTALSVLRGVMTDNLYINFNILGDIFEIGGIQPSGKYGTTEDNCLRNLVIMMYVFYKCTPNRNFKFFDKVEPLFNGDDLLVSVKKDVVGWFNAVDYSTACKQYLNMEFTSATKGTVLLPTIRIEEATFLKRRFVYSHLFERWVAPLSVSSVHKTLYWTIPSRSITSYEQHKSMCMSALMELVLHVKDSLQYERIRVHFIFVLSSHYDVAASAIECDFKTYEEQVERLKDQRSESLIEDGQGEKDGNALLLQNVSTPMSTGIDSTVDVYTESANRNQILREQIEHIKNMSFDTTSMTGFMDQLKQMKSQLESMSSMLTVNPRNLAAWKRKFFRKKLTHISVQDSFNLAYLSKMADIEATMKVIRYIEEISDINIVTESDEASSGTVTNLTSEYNLKEVDGAPSTNVQEDEVKVEDIGFQNVSDISEFLSRPINLVTFDISTPGGSISNSYGLWDLWSSEPSVRAKLRNFAYFRGEMCIKITLSGTPFHYGRVLVSYQPWPSQNQTLQSLLNIVSFDATQRPLLLNYLSQSKERVVMNVNENKPLYMRIPFIHVKPLARLFNTSSTVISAITDYEDISPMGDLFVYTINNAESVSATPSSISANMYVWMENVSLGTNTGTQIDITTESDERERGPVERYTAAASDIISYVGKAPVIGPLAKASSIVLKGVSGIAGFFGWSKPIMIDEPCYVKNNGFTNSMNLIGPETGYKMTADPKQELTIDPRIGGDIEDPMSLAHIYQRETYLTTFTWPATAPEMLSSIFLSLVHPYLTTTTNAMPKRQFMPTAMCFAAMPFKYWNGIVKFRFEIVCSKYHRGKLAFYFEPNVAQRVLISSDVELNKHYIGLVDIQDTQSIEFCVDWANSFAWCEQPDVLYTVNNYGAGISGNHSISNGYIGVVPFTQLQSPDDSDVQVNVYVSGEKLTFNQIVPTGMDWDRDIVTQSDSSSVPVTCMTLNPSTGNLNDSCMYHFGETVYSFRAIGKRYVTSNVLFGASIGTGNVVRYKLPIFTQQVPYGVVRGPGQVPNMFDYLRYAYLGMRGGVKKHIRYVSKESNGQVLQQCRVILDTPTSSFSIPTVSVSTESYPGIQGYVTFLPHSNAGIAVELPFYSKNLFVFCQSPTLTSSLSSDTYNTSFSRDYFFEVDVSDPSVTVSGDCYEETAFGEDFTFLRFLGSPLFVANF